MWLNGNRHKIEVTLMKGNAQTLNSASAAKWPGKKSDLPQPIFHKFLPSGLVSHHVLVNPHLQGHPRENKNRKESKLYKQLPASLGQTMASTQSHWHSGNPLVTQNWDPEVPTEKSMSPASIMVTSRQVNEQGQMSLTDTPVKVTADVRSWRLLSLAKDWQQK